MFDDALLLDDASLSRLLATEQILAGAKLPALQ